MMTDNKPDKINTDVDLLFQVLYFERCLEYTEMSTSG